ncbi:hypothetical protein LOK49_LG03G02281 [Camellia lanceoleosa]|uniref:Uncharacterized protein n=1 Tax=Camellia lanceoleosa TaxID=1840588 RepID=A0ACC0IF50_9ERIC|nr:hypothetical protein LOK49_LG03G02281 [Camellia lanceoleosa]
MYVTAHQQWLRHQFNVMRSTTNNLLLRGFDDDLPAKNWFSIKAVLDLRRLNNAFRHFSDSRPKVKLLRSATIFGIILFRDQNSKYYTKTNRYDLFN